MAVFAYEARDAAGARREGTVEAETGAAAAVALREQGLYPVRIRAAAPDSPGWAAGFWQRLRPVAPAHLAQFFTQLASLIRSGVNAHEAMDEVSTLLGDDRLARVAREITPRLAAGEGLADGLARYPAFFPAHVPAAVRACEQFGGLPDVLESLAEQFATDAAIEGRLRWVRWYYGVVLVLAVLVAPFPQFLTQGIGWYARLALTMLLPALLGAFLLAWLLRGVMNLPRLARVRSSVLLALPALGPMLRWSALARLLDTLHLSQRAGVSLDRGVEMAGAATGHPRMTDAADRAAERMRRGEPLAEALRDTRLLPSRAREMLASGAGAGRLEASVIAAATWAKEHRDHAVNAVAGSAAGGALAVGAVVTLIALAIAWRNYYEAIFQMAGGD